MSEKKVVKKIEFLGGGLTKEESRKVFGGTPECHCDDILWEYIRAYGPWY